MTKKKVPTLEKQDEYLMKLSRALRGESMEFYKSDSLDRFYTLEKAHSILADIVIAYADVDHSDFDIYIMGDDELKKIYELKTNLKNLLPLLRKVILESTPGPDFHPRLLRKYAARWDKIGDVPPK